MFINQYQIILELAVDKYLNDKIKFTVFFEMIYKTWYLSNCLVFINLNMISNDMLLILCGMSLFSEVMTFV